MKMLAKELKAYRFSQAIVLHNLEFGGHASALLLKSVCFMIGLTLGTIVGWIAILLAILEAAGLSDVQGFLNAHHLAVPALLCGFWAGFVGRLAVASKFDVKRAREASPSPSLEETPDHMRNVWLVHGLMAAGYLALLVLWLPAVSSLHIAWGIVLMGIGWQTAHSAIFYILESKPTIRRDLARAKKA